MRTNGVMTDEIINAVNNIVMDLPEFYIDKIMQQLREDTGIYLNVSSVYRILREKIGG